MVHASTIVAGAAALLLASPAAAAGLYHKSSPVIQVDAKSYDRLIAKSNYTSVGFNIWILETFPSQLTIISDCRVLRAMVWSLQEPPATI
jgi:hypothetical protein